MGGAIGGPDESGFLRLHRQVKKVCCKKAFAYFVVNFFEVISASTYKV